MITAIDESGPFFQDVVEDDETWKTYLVRDLQFGKDEKEEEVIVGEEKTATKEAATEEVPIEEVAAEEVATKEATIEEAPTEEAAIEGAATEEAATEEVTTKEAATEEAATEEAATEEAATEEAATEEAATEETTTKEAASKEAAIVTKGEIVTEKPVSNENVEIDQEIVRDDNGFYVQKPIEKNSNNKMEKVTNPRMIWDADLIQIFNKVCQELKSRGINRVAKEIHERMVNVYHVDLSREQVSSHLQAALSDAVTQAMSQPSEASRSPLVDTMVSHDSESLQQRARGREELAGRSRSVRTP